MYHETARAYRPGKKPRRTGRSTGNKGPGSKEKLRLFQLLICFILFLAVFVGKGIFPAKLVQIRDNILSLITSDTDFRSAFSALGDSLSDNTVFDQLGDFCIAVFGMEEQSSEPQGSGAAPALASMAAAERCFLSGNPDELEIADHLLYQSPLKISLTSQDEGENQSVDTLQAQSVPEPEAVPAAGTLILKSDYSGEALPEHYTMDQLSLGGLETITPVLGYINSEYGYREHPVSGEHQFHGGVDISGDAGDPIYAFASGTVEYVGEDDSYGLYLQLDHGNGVKSFYAHCDEVCVKKGQEVALGEQIGEVGSSGRTTGPHLHLELKYNKMHLNPIYYIDYLSL